VIILSFITTDENIAKRNILCRVMFSYNCILLGGKQVEQEPGVAWQIGSGGE
jgi:hypothetical protein